MVIIDSTMKIKMKKLKEENVQLKKEIIKIKSIRLKNTPPQLAYESDDDCMPSPQQIAFVQSWWKPQSINNHARR